jgi:Ras-related protein Ral-A
LTKKFVFHLFSSEQILRVKNGNTNIPAILVGNKIDLADKRKITAEEAEQKARSWAIKFIETSAKTKYNVDKAFCELMRIVRPIKATINTDGNTHRHPTDTTDRDTGKKCCVIL